MTQDRLEALRGILSALEEKIDDELSWKALHDIGVECDGECCCLRLGLHDHWGRALAIMEAFVCVSTEAKSQIKEVCLYSHYSEQGYSTPESGIIAVGNWNNVTRRIERDYTEDVLDDSPHHLAELLEALGANLEWSDEWSSCENCDGLVRLVEDSHFWTPSFNEALYRAGSVVCLKCKPESETLISEEESS